MFRSLAVRIPPAENKTAAISKTISENGPIKDSLAFDGIKIIVIHLKFTTSKVEFAKKV